LESCPRSDPLYERRRIHIGYVIDTWTWVEYYSGRITEVREYIEHDNNDLFTSVLTLTEMIKFLGQTQDEHTVESVVHDIRIRSLVVPVSREIAILAGGYKRQGFHGGIADTIILATARMGNHKIVTGDLHFQDLPDAVFIEHP
jgi:predicted nucleic acid-binding protein